MSDRERAIGAVGPLDTGESWPRDIVDAIESAGLLIISRARLTRVLRHVTTKRRAATRSAGAGRIAAGLLVAAIEGQVTLRARAESAERDHYRVADIAAFDDLATRVDGLACIMAVVDGPMPTKEELDIGHDEACAIADAIRNCADWRRAYRPGGRVVHLVEQPTWLSTLAQAWREVPADIRHELLEIMYHSARHYRGWPRSLSRTIRIAAALLRALESSREQ